MNKKYQISLSSEDWNSILCCLWCGHDYNLHNKIQNELLKRYEQIEGLLIVNTDVVEEVD